ncbi:phosphoribosylaminoimidazole-succinocarboxamide synthase [Bacteroidia bacterium]|nr:phosphoribosylaminoimidazole-succinocarboxamide synthase [Bacteroidia bacterium]
MMEIKIYKYMETRITESCTVHHAPCTNTLVGTDYHFQGQAKVYRGKVRDVYFIGEDILVMIATDRISAFDVILPQGIPYKGQVLNQIASKFLDATVDIVPNWKLATPDPMVTVGLRCEPFKVEMVIRGYLTGSAWREYKAGARTLCGLALPEGMKENQKFATPIITPTTKADEGHDENISKEEIIAQGLVSKEDYEQLEKYTQALFQRGTEIAAQKGLILVDTKYEFGKKEGKIYLIDEIHTPDSSRYFYAEGYRERFEKGEEQKQLSKEFVRKWLMENGFQGKEGQKVPEMTPEYCESVSERYIELYENITGEKFMKSDISDVSERIEKNITKFFTHNL